MIVILGTPGAGKTTVVKTAGLKAVVYGDVMFQIAKEKYGISHRDEMRKRLSSAQQKEIQREAAKRISKTRPEVLDTHPSIKTPFGYLPGLPRPILDLLPVSAFVLITAPPEQILQRRKKDVSRKRDEESEEEIALHQSINLAFSSFYAAYKGVPLKVIENPDGGLERAAQELRRLKECLS